MNTRSGDGREMVLAEGAEPAIRPLPLALSAQEKLADGHDGSRVVGLITRAWIDGDMLWAEGSFDLEDEHGRDWAAKVGRGTASWVSADLSDIAVEEVPLRTDGTEWGPGELEAAWQAFDAAAADMPTDLPQPVEQPMAPDVTNSLMRVTEWKLMGVTLVSSPAFEQARIQPVYGEEFTPAPAQETLTAAAAQHTGAMIALIPSQEDAARLAVDGYEPADVLHTTLVFLGDAAAWTPEQRDALEAAVSEVGVAPMTGQIWGHAAFNPASDEPCAVYLVEAEGITSLRSAVLGAFEEAGTYGLVPEQHECYVPHITAGYGLDAAQLTETGAIRFDRLQIWFADTDIRDIPLDAVTASLVAGAVVYDRADFEMPEADELTALTVTDDGRVFGHLAQSDSCHIGFADVCVIPPTSNTDYAYFHQGEVSTTDGPLAVGKLTLGTGHAGLRAGARAAAEHYDNTGSAVAIVRCSDGLWGPWLSGRILPGVDDERIAELRRSGVSGDWRAVQRNSSQLELVAVLAVNVPGFPVPRTKALAASGMRSLIAAGVPRRTPPTENGNPVVAGVNVQDLAKHVAVELRATEVRESRRSQAASRVRAVRLAAAARRIGRAADTPGIKDKGARQLERYWTESPEGLAKWAEKYHPYTSLVEALTKAIPPGEMTPEQIKGLAANYYHKVFKVWPGKHNEKKDKN
ncbi:2'-5' RNA ligase family protein [Rhodococcus sp. AG1013]|uniref:2'-5' RNA ligase family protein n=1 Tax=Rhodococcus sp. AG1013 TaxID=2183996 RepID=UPI0011C06EC1|nr:2'-5' RNA ligase family protein [Rhodococcus sp. AG1013]